jgi:hypothetical protein
MADEVDELMRSAFIGGFKCDVVLEASRDLEYIGAIRARFAEAGDLAARHATACSVRLIEDLVAKGFCSLAKWERGYGSKPRAIRVTHDELVVLVEATTRRDAPPFAHFLITTPAGDVWVERYHALEREL